MANRWAYGIFLVLGLAVVSFIVAGFIGIFMDLSPSARGTGNVMLISVSGAITSQPSQGLFSAEPSMSDFIVRNLEEAGRDPSIDAVILSIDSPGGGAVASHEVVEAMKALDKPKVAVIRSLGASGAYWIASAADTIFANPLSIVGSIGVTSSYLEVSGLLERYNITYERLVAGDFKDTGSPLRALEEEEREMLQGQIDRVHEIFMDDVAANRALSAEALDAISEGRIFLGDEGLEYGLIDHLGNVDDAKTYLEEDMNVTIRLREAQRSGPMFPFLASATEAFAFNFGRGFASWLIEDDSQDELFSLI